MNRFHVFTGAVAGIALLGACSFKASVGDGTPTTPPPPAAVPPPPPEAAPPPVPEAAPPAPTPAAPTAEPAAPVVQDGRINIPGNIVFDHDKADIRLDDQGTLAVLQQLKKYLDTTPRVTKLRIEGHTDNVGGEAHNLELSGQRALSVKKWLIGQGEKAGRLLAVGFGMSRPVADNSTDQGKAQNRRTEFHYAEVDGRPYLGRPAAGPPGGKVFQ